MVKFQNKVLAFEMGTNGIICLVDNELEIPAAMSPRVDYTK
jgi:hypothetical protein